MLAQKINSCFSFLIQTNRHHASTLSEITRFVEPIDRTSYKLWSSSSPHVTHADYSLEHLDQRTPSDSDADISKNQTAETETTKLSFAEVMQLVQEGKEVPGAIKLDIKPSNQSPTPSQMERILKPWETPSSPK